MRGAPRGGEGHGADEACKRKERGYLLDVSKKEMNVPANHGLGAKS